MKNRIDWVESWIIRNPECKWLCVRKGNYLFWSSNKRSTLVRFKTKEDANLFILKNVLVDHKIHLSTGPQNIQFDLKNRTFKTV